MSILAWNTNFGLYSLNQNSISCPRKLNIFRFGILMFCHLRQRRTNVAFQKNGHRFTGFAIHVCPRIGPDVMFATTGSERSNKFDQPRRRCRVENNENGYQTGGAGFTRKREFFGKPPLTASSNRDAQFELVCKLVLAIIAINLTACVGWFIKFIQTFHG